MLVSREAGLGLWRGGTAAKEKLLLAPKSGPLLRSRSRTAPRTAQRDAVAGKPRHGGGLIPGTFITQVEGQTARCPLPLAVTSFKCVARSSRAVVGRRPGACVCLCVPVCHGGVPGILLQHLSTLSAHHMFYSAVTNCDLSPQEALFGASSRSGWPCHLSSNLI